MDKLTLTPAFVKLIGQKRKNRRHVAGGRDGFVDQNGQVFLPPKKVKLIEAWREKMGF